MIWVGYFYKPLPFETKPFYKLVCVRFGPISNHFGHKLIIMYHSFFVLVFSLLFNAILTNYQTSSHSQGIWIIILLPSIANWLQAQRYSKYLLFLVFFLEEKQDEEAEETLYRSNNNNKVTTIIIIIKYILLNILQKYYNSRGKMM